MYLVITADMKQSRNADNLHLSDSIAEINKDLKPIVPAELYAGDEFKYYSKIRVGNI